MDKMRTDDGKLRYALYLTFEELICVDHFLRGGFAKPSTSQFEIDCAISNKNHVSTMVEDMIRNIIEDYGK